MLNLTSFVTGEASHNGFIENFPKIKYSDPGIQSGVLFPLITNDPVGAI